MAAITKTSIREELDRNAISALLYQPEKKLIKMAITIAADMGRPIANCFKSFLLLSLLVSQYAINLFSSSVSMMPAKLKHKGMILL